MVDKRNSDGEKVGSTDKLTISPEVSLREALQRIGAGCEKALVVVDENNCLVGTLSDGDVRRAILRGTELSSGVSSAINRSPRWLSTERAEICNAKHLFQDKGVSLVPVVDSEGRVRTVLTRGDCFHEDLLPEKRTLKIPVVIMAGGRGTRLAPFTHVLPKPLIPVNAKSIIEHIISQFRAHDINKFYLMVRDKSKLLRAFFEELSPAYEINFIEEIEPLGTVGGLRNLRGQLKTEFFVTNCDILTDLDYADLLGFHLNSDSAITLVGCSKTSVLPYGVCHLAADGYLDQIEEKPSRDILVNTGLYVLSPRALELIPDHGGFDMPDLIREVSGKGGRVGVYPVSEDAWHDVGEWPEYKKTVAFFSGQG